ncbi:hypothetical protein C8Q76DRAFT_743489 [Earliella scabrosa]|nr:hypothetical protein C8Q76DRAFT_743489 [Earliella scabrosa]
MLADLQDLRPDNERTIPPTIRTLFAKESIFRPSSSMVLLLDLAILDVGRLAESLQDLVRTSVIAFARKYDTELQEDMDLLRNVAPTRALSLVAGTCLERGYELFLGIDNYTAPYERCPEQQWEDITELLNRHLYKLIRALLRNKRLTRALFVGNSTTAARASRWGRRRTFSKRGPSGFVDQVREESDGEDFDSLHRVPFTGALSDMVADRSIAQPRFQDVMGMTEKEIRALGQVCLGSGDRLWDAVQSTLRPTTYEGPLWVDVGVPILPIYAFTDVFARLRHLLGKPNDDRVTLRADVDER